MIRSVILLLIALAIALLALLNWGTLAAPSVVSLGVATVNAPLGIIMLGLTVLLAVFFVAYVLYLQSSVLMDTRRHNKEMQNQRELADKAEASRFTDLRNFLETHHQQDALEARTAREALIERIQRLESTIAARMEQSDAATAAYVGELEDRLERHAVVTPARPVPVAPPTVVDPATGTPR